MATATTTLLCGGSNVVHCHVVGRSRTRVRVMVRVHEDKGDGEDDNNIVAQGQQRCCRGRVVGHEDVRVCKDEGDDG